jgi:hypothetical protein
VGEDDPLFSSGASFLLRPLGGGEPLPAEYDPEDRALRFLVGEIGQGEELGFSVEPDEGGPRAESIFSFEQREDRFDLFRAGALCLSYHFGAQAIKPYVNPLNGPDGRSVLRESLPPGTGKDHPWQRGITLMHGSVNGVDCWNEIPGEPHGRTVQDSIRAVTTPVSASLHSRNTWRDSEGRPLMTDARTFRVFSSPGWPLALDIRITLEASHGDVRLGSTKEAGFLAIRLDPALSGESGGLIENCYGARGELECWGQPAHWVDCSGGASEKRVGVAVFDHPRNLRYPARWHVRAYGLLAPNVWHWDAPFAIREGGSLAFRWRLVVHEGDADHAGVRDLFLDWEPGHAVLEQEKGAQKP